MIRKERGPKATLACSFHADKFYLNWKTGKKIIRNWANAELSVRRGEWLPQRMSSTIWCKFEVFIRLFLQLNEVILVTRFLRNICGSMINIWQEFCCLFSLSYFDQVRIGNGQPFKSLTFGVNPCNWSVLGNRLLILHRAWSIFVWWITVAFKGHFLPWCSCAPIPNLEVWLRYSLFRFLHWLNDKSYLKILNDSIKRSIDFSGVYISHKNTTVDERYLGLGIRLEDDILITDHGPEVLTTSCPKHPDEVEKLVGEDWK